MTPQGLTSWVVSAGLIAAALSGCTTLPSFPPEKQARIEPSQILEGDERFEDPSAPRLHESSVSLKENASPLRAPAASVPARTAEPGGHLISVNGSARATAYSMSSKIVRLGRWTHVTYLEKDERIFVRSFNEWTRKWNPPVYIGQGFDNHAAPTMAADSRGHLHIIYGPHHGEFQYRVSVRPNDTSKWETETRFGTFGTYASIVIDRDDLIHVVYRGGKTRFRKLIYQRKHVRDTSWSQPVELADGNPSFMVSYDSSIALQNNGTLHVTYNFYSSAGMGMEKDGGRRIGYLKSSDQGRTWTDASGASQQLPVRFETTPILLDDPEYRLRLSNLTVDLKGNLFFTINRVIPGSKSVSIVKLPPGGKPIEYCLNALIDSDTHELDVYAQSTIDSRQRIWIAAPVIKKGEKWGGPSTGLFVFRIPSTFVQKDLHIVEYISPHMTTSAGGGGRTWDSSWLPSFEVFVGHNSISRTPRLLYTVGYGNRSHSLATAIPTQVRFREFR